MIKSTCEDVQSTMRVDFHLPHCGTVKYLTPLWLEMFVVCVGLKVNLIKFAVASQTRVLRYDFFVV